MGRAGLMRWRRGRGTVGAGNPALDDEDYLESTSEARMGGFVGQCEELGMRREEIAGRLQDKSSRRG